MINDQGFSSKLFLNLPKRKDLFLTSSLTEKNSDFYTDVCEMFSLLLYMSSISIMLIKVEFALIIYYITIFK